MLGGLNDGPLAAGDVDGDGKADLLLGDGSQVRVLSGAAFTPLVTFTGVTARALHALDWNGDGKAEIVIGQSSIESAFVVLGRSAFSGSASLADYANWIITGEQAGDQFGWSLGSGDLDADGAADLIIGSRSHVLNTRSDAHFNDAGAVYVLYSQSGLQSIYLPLVMK